MWKREELAFPGLAVALVSLALFVFIGSFSFIKMPHRRPNDYTLLGIYWLFLADAHATKAIVTLYTNPKQSVRERRQQVKGLCKNTFGPPLFSRGASEREMWQRLRASHALRSDARTLGN